MNNLNFSNQVDPNVLSIIIPVYKDLAGLTDTIGSIKDCNSVEGHEIEIIVVNDGADADISKYCEENKLVEVRISPNRGSYFARNRGVEASHGALIGFVDADIFVDKNWCQSAVTRLKEFDYVGGNICVIRTGVSATVADYQQLIDFNTRWHMETIHYAPTANVWVRRGLIEQLGGFNETLFSSGDLEFGRRVFNDGRFKQIYADEVIVRHPPRTLKGLIAKSKRLAFGHHRISESSDLHAEFTLFQSLKRNLVKSGGRRLPFKVSVLRFLLYGNRLFFRAYYKKSFSESEFQTVVSGQTKVDILDNR